jgi:outer membrane lipoprotein-sorting protein
MSKTGMSKSPWIVLLLLACLVLVPAAGFSEDWAGLSKQLGERCAKFHADVKDLSLVMEMKATTPQGEVATAMTVFQKGEKSRAEIKMQGMPGGAEMPPAMADMTILVIRDGKKTWMISPMTGKMEVPEEQAKQYKNQWYCDDYIPAEADLAGSETVSGRDCFVVVVKDPSSLYAKLWIDKKGLDPVKTEMKPLEGKTMTALFSDYKTLSGDWQFPYKTEMFQDKTLVSTMIVKSVEVNKGVSDDLFDAEKVKTPERNMMDMMKKTKGEDHPKEKQE